MGGELWLGFSSPLLIREHSLAPIPHILGIGATNERQRFEAGDWEPNGPGLS
jgi:hypothetical protein